MSDGPVEINVDALTMSSQMTGDVNEGAGASEGGAVNMDVLYGLAEKYFAEHPDMLPSGISSKIDKINAFLQMQALNQGNSQNQAPAPQETQPSAASPQQNQSGDLFGALFEGFVRAALHEAMHHHFHCACPHGHFSHFSFGLPPHWGHCHDRFCHRVDARDARDRVMSRVGSFELGEGIGRVIKGNTAGGIAEAVGGAATIASVLLNKKNRDRC